MVDAYLKLIAANLSLHVLQALRYPRNGGWASFVIIICTSYFPSQTSTFENR